MAKETVKQNQKVKGEVVKMKAENAGTVQEAVESVNEVDYKGSNEFDVQKAQQIMAGMVRREEIMKELKEIEMEREKVIQEMVNGVERTKLELQAKTKMTETIATAATGVAAIAGLTTMGILSTLTNKEIKLEELRIGAE